jgi:dolichol-phosphate mannosyltransferase
LNRKPVSVVVPAYNESDCIDEHPRRLALVFDAEPEYVWEAIIVENGFLDGTWLNLQQFHENDSRFKMVRLARNFRMDRGLTAGLEFATGDACVLMTADLQDPPELIPEFLRKWEVGYENICSVVTGPRGTGPIRTFNSKVFYWPAGRMTDSRIPNNASDFRLLDRRVYEAVRSMQERNSFFRGLAAWVGFESVGIPMARPPRFAGESKAYSLKVIELAFKGICAHSYVSRRLIRIVGVGLSVLAVFGLVVSGIYWLVAGVPFCGFGTIVPLVLLLVGVPSFMPGIVSEYVGLLYEEVKGRPNFVVSRTLGIPYER